MKAASCLILGVILLAAGAAGSRADDKLAPPGKPSAGDLIATACSPANTQAEKLAALESLAKMVEIEVLPPPLVHRLAKALDDDSLEVRRAASWALRRGGPAATLYIDQMLAAYTGADNNFTDIRQVGWIMDQLHWAPARAILTMTNQLTQRGESADLNQLLQYMQASQPETREVADAILAMPDASAIGGCAYWLADHAAGDHRFTPALLEALHEDWKRDDICFGTQYLADGLAAVGRGDAELIDTVTEILKKPLAPDARLFMGKALSRLSGDPKHLADALVWVFEHKAEKSQVYTKYHVLELVGQVDPAVAHRLKPFEPALAELIEGLRHENPAGYFKLTGKKAAVLAWARGDLDEAAHTNIVSTFLETSIFELGPTVGELTPPIIDLLKNGNDYNQPRAALALVAIGPTPETRGLADWVFRRAGEESAPAVLRADLAMTMWACADKSADALEILVPLLDDQGWGTSHCAWVMGQMGRDAKAALPRLREAAGGPNPAYAYWAGEAVRQIEAELARQVEPAAAYEELGSDNYRVSIRALWRMVDMGQPAAKLIRDRLARDDTPRLPGVKLRHQTRARQVLAALELTP